MIYFFTPITVTIPIKPVLKLKYIVLEFMSGVHIWIGKGISYSKNRFNGIINGLWYRKVFINPTWWMGATVLANTAPFTLPGPFRNPGECRFGTVYMVGDVTIITQNNISFIILFTASFTNCTVQATPTLL